VVDEGHSNPLQDDSAGAAESEYLHRWQAALTTSLRLDGGRLRLQYRTLYAQLVLLCKTKAPMPPASTRLPVGNAETPPNIVPGVVVGAPGEQPATGALGVIVGFRSEQPTAEPRPASPGEQCGAGCAPQPSTVGGTSGAASPEAIRIDVEGVTTASAPADFTGMSEPARQLLQKLAECSTDFEREEAVLACFSHEKSGAEVISCAELARLSLTFTFSSRRRAILVALYPHLKDKASFVDLLEGPGGFRRESDRQKVLLALRLV